jgi:GNAT superfamily N-acetyltransferase
MSVSVREATAADGGDMARLLDQLGYSASPAELVTRLARVQEHGGGTALLAMDGHEAVGLATIYLIRTLHRPGDICRLTALVIDERRRGAGIGRMLVDATEAYARARDCIRVEVTSSYAREEAHAFYLHLGYTDKPKRFVKDL